MRRFFVMIGWGIAILAAWILLVAVLPHDNKRSQIREPGASTVPRSLSLSNSIPSITPGASMFIAGAPGSGMGACYTFNDFRTLSNDIIDNDVVSERALIAQGRCFSIGSGTSVKVLEVVNPVPDAVEGLVEVETHAGVRAWVTVHDLSAHPPTYRTVPAWLKNKVSSKKSRHHATRN